MNLSDIGIWLIMLAPLLILLLVFIRMYRKADARLKQMLAEGDEKESSEAEREKTDFASARGKKTRTDPGEGRSSEGGAGGSLTTRGFSAEPDRTADAFGKRSEEKSKRQTTVIPDKPVDVAYHVLFRELPLTDYWVCPVCGTENHNSLTVCGTCTGSRMRRA